MARRPIRVTWVLAAILAIVVLGGTTGLLAYGLTIGSTTVSLLPVWEWGFGEERYVPIPGQPPDPDVCYYYGVFSVWVRHHGPPPLTEGRPVWASRDEPR